MANINNAINNTVGASNSGVTNTLTVTNPSNTASSDAQELITVGGSSAGDAYTTYQVLGSRTYSLGIDNSTATDALVLTDAGNPSSGNLLMTIQPTISRATFGYGLDSNINRVWSRNAGATGAGSCVVAGIGVSATGDSFFTAEIESVRSYCFGIDNSDSDILKINTTNSSDVTPSTGTNIWSMTTAGELTMPLQPAFLATLGTTDTNATGAGTTFTLGTGNALTEIFDQGGDFVTTGTFTAPVTGRYQLSFQLVYGALTAAMTSVTANIVVSNRTFGGGNINIGLVRTIASAADLCYSTKSVLADMDAADTFTVATTIAGGVGDTASIVSSSARVFMSGFLAC